MSPAPTHPLRVDRVLDWFLPHLARFYTRLWHRCTWRRPRQLPGGAVVVVANHPSHADSSFLMAGYGRRIHFLQAREQFEIVVVRHFFRLLGCIPVARGAADISAIRQALQRLEQGAAIGVFPEGDVEKPDDQRPGAGHGGAALLALRGGAAIVPAFIQGPQARGIISDWFRFNRGVRITFGHPIPLDRYRKLPLTRDRLREVTDLLMQKIEELRPHPGSAAKPN